MAWFRYVLYFFGIALLTAIVVRLEVAYPGSLRLQEFVSGGDEYGTSEFSAIEIIQLLILLTCGALMAWVAQHSHTQRPLAFLFGGLALVFMIRELHYYFDQYAIDNLWQVLAGICGALLIAYCYRHLKRLNIALARIWPSPGLTLIFAGAIICRGVHRVDRLPAVADRDDRIRIPVEGAHGAGTEASGRQAP